MVEKSKKKHENSEDVIDLFIICGKSITTFFIVRTAFEHILQTSQPVPRDKSTQ